MNWLSSWASLIALVVILLSPSFVRSQTAVPKADPQNWNDVQLIVPLSKKVDFFFQGTLRIGGNFTAAVDERFGIGFNVKANQYLTVHSLYFHRDARPPHGQFEYEDRITIGATLQKPLGKFTLSDRNWFERRWREPQVDAWRHRNRVRLEHPFKINKSNFTWFVSDEVFYDWSAHDWVRNRATVGATHTFNKHFTGELYYLRQNDGRSRPGDLNIIGTLMRFRL
jgi:Protein of unknown function (DUF2490)